MIEPSFEKVRRTCDHVLVCVSEVISERCSTSQDNVESVYSVMGGGEGQDTNHWIRELGDRTELVLERMNFSADKVQAGRDE